MLPREGKVISECLPFSLRQFLAATRVLPVLVGFEFTLEAALHRVALGRAYLSENLVGQFVQWYEFHISNAT